MAHNCPLRRLQETLQALPVNNPRVSQLQEWISCCTADQLQELGLSPPDKPTAPVRFPDNVPIEAKLQAIQDTISSFQYNYTPTNYFNVSKRRPFHRIMETCRDILREGLPIKCIEASFLGMFLTSGMAELSRFTIGFKSQADGQVYRHIVLALHHLPSGRFGALGLSRREELAYKPLRHGCLADLVGDFKAGYEMWGHRVLKVRVGLPVEHDLCHSARVCWRFCNISLAKHSWETACHALNNHAAHARKLQAVYKATNVKPQPLRIPHTSCSGSAPAVLQSSSSPKLLPCSGPAGGGRTAAAGALSPRRATVGPLTPRGSGGGASGIKAGSYAAQHSRIPAAPAGQQQREEGDGADSDSSVSSFDGCDSDSEESCCLAAHRHTS